MFVNYGDKNFFEYGVLVDSEHSDTEFQILFCRPFDDEEDMFFFADCNVDIDDSWINRDDVLSFIGMNEKEFDPMRYAIGCIEYYGAENFSSPYEGYKFNRKDIEERLKHYPIASDNLDIAW